MTGSILPGRLDRIEYAVAGERLIHGLTLDLEAGPRTIVLGANGAGKSLTLRLAHGLLRPTGGRITWQRPDAQRRITGKGSQTSRHCRRNSAPGLRSNRYDKSFRFDRCGRIRRRTA